MAPSFIEKLGAKYDRELNNLLKEQPERTPLIERRRAEIKEILDRYATSLPKDIWLDTLQAEMTPRVVEALSRMTWRFLTFDKRSAFLTCDNPVFYFSNIGIGRPMSEVSFPISSNIALLATWRTDIDEGYFPTRDSVVHQMNRRTASIATRYGFHACNERWAFRYLAKPVGSLKSSCSKLAWV